MHEHSNNIKVVNAENGHETICGCGYVNLHQHNYNNYYQYNNTHHKLCCKCGEQRRENHKFVNGTTGKYCVKCGYKPSMLGGVPIEIILQKSKVAFLPQYMCN